MGFAERSLAAAGAAVVSAVLVNPLDVAKVRTVVWSGAAAGPALSLTRVPRAPVVATLRCVDSVIAAALRIIAEFVNWDVLS